MFKLQHYLNLLTLAFLLSYCKAQLNATLQAEAKLIANITSGYNRMIRPEELVEIVSTIQLKQIISIDEKDQIMTSSVYISQLWFDPRLVWDPTIWSGIRALMIPAKTVWIPDTYIINTAETDGYFKLNNDFSLITVRYDGNVFLILPVSALKTRCTLHTKSFPFDKQACNITYTSWSQGSNRIQFSDLENSVDLSDYAESRIWKLLSTNVSVTPGTYRVPFEYANNTNINVVLNIQRKPLYFMMNGVFACLVLNCITLILYAVPFFMQLGLSMTTFLTYSVYSVNFSNSTPPQSDFLPLITLYFVLSITFTLISMFWFTLCNHLSNNLQTIPKWLIKFCGFLQRELFCCFETKEPNIFLCCCKSKPKLSDDDSEKGGSLRCLVVEYDGKLKGEKSKLETDEKNGELPKEKCNFCNRCADCQKDFDKDKEKNKTKSDTETKIKALRCFVFICAFLYCLSFQLSIWLSLS